MNHRWNVGPALRRTAWVLGLVLLARPAAAQQPPVLVSLTADDALGTMPVRDQDVVVHWPGAAARLAWPSETLSLLAGDLDGDGLHDVFGDVDALHDAGGGSTAGEELYLSLTSDQHGFQDGDVLRAGTGGYEVLVAEAAFLTATGAVDGNVDVDAFQLDVDGTVWFSFAEDEDSSFLSGDVPGQVLDGAILRWAAGDALASVAYTESQVSAMVSQALGATVSVGDTKGLARDPASGSLWFSVQSPTAEDASVFSDAAGGSRAAGHAEAEFGFAGSAELDALTVATRSFPCLAVSVPNPTPGSGFDLTLLGAQAGAPHWILASFERGPSLLALNGWGGLVLVSDAMFAASLAVAPTLALFPDANGVALLPALMPVGVAPVDLVLQAVSVVPGAVASNPLVVEVGQ